MFYYKVRERNGRSLEGVIEAESKDLAANKLRKEGYYITEIKEEKKGIDIKEQLNRLKRVGLKDLAIFCRHFSTMISSGLSLVRTLEILTQQTANPKLKQAIILIKKDVENGIALSQALEKQQDIFPRIFISMVQAGETGGILDETLQNIADHFEREDEIKQKVVSALAYPIVITLVAMTSVFFLVTFVLPTFINLFGEMKMQLPLPTLILLKMSNFISNHWYFLLLGLAIILLIGKRYYQSYDGRRKVDSLLLKAPIFGELIMKLTVDRFTRTLGVLIESGVSILESFDIVSDLVNNQVIKDKIDQARQSISEGESLTLPLNESGLFPKMMLQMIRVGEETGDLDQMLEEVASFYDQEVEYKIDRIVSLIEPAMILIIGIIVSGIVASMMLPLFNMYSGF